MQEIELQVNNFNELTKFLNLFSLLQQSCQINISKNGTEIFGKFLSGRCDLFTNALSISNMMVDMEADKKATIFIGDLKKFLYVLEMLNKYYDTSDSTPFLTREIRFLIGEDMSYFRIASKKYTIKFQLSSNAVVKATIGDSMNYSLGASKYATSAHSVFIEGKSILGTIPFLVAFKTDKKKIANISSLLSALNESSDVRIKIELPEQVVIEPDLTDSSSTSMTAIPNTLYAVLSDNQKMIGNKIGNKICAVLGNITNLDPDYKKHCRVDTLTDNFVYLLSVDQLKLISSLLTSFAPAVVKPTKKSKKQAPGDIIQPESSESEIEIGLSKVNIMHLNLISQISGCTTEFYISFIGQNA